MLTTIIVFIIVFSLLILVHELGHFYTAKKFGAKVEEFGFGYPPRIFGIKKGETIYSINWIPFGGFVKILGENMEEDKKNDSRSFANKSVNQRFLIIVSGVLMNLLLAVVLFSIGNMIGIPQEISNDLPSYAHIQKESRKVQIVYVSNNSPAEQSGIEVGDEILNIETVDGQKITASSVGGVINFINEQKGSTLLLEIKRGDNVLQKTVEARKDVPENEGPTGVGLAETAIVSYPWHLAIYRGIIDVYSLFVLLFVLLLSIIKNLVATGSAGMDIAGPIGIAVMTGQVAKMGLLYIMQFTAVISVNLALVNLLPLPALDGGRLLFLAIEKIKGSPVKKNVENIVHTVGFFLLIALMILVTYKDVVRYFF